MGDSEHELIVLRQTLLGINICSLVLGFLLILTYVRFKRSFPHTSVLLFAVASFFLSVSLLLGEMAGFESLKKEGAACLTQGFLIQFFGFSAVAFYFVIVLTLSAIVFGRDLEGQVGNLSSSVFSPSPHHTFIFSETHNTLHFHRR